jgi:hypothetical protein
MRRCCVGSRRRGREHLLHGGIRITVLDYLAVLDYSTRLQCREMGIEIWQLGDGCSVVCAGDSTRWGVWMPVACSAVSVGGGCCAAACQSVSRGSASSYL